MAGEAMKSVDGRRMPGACRSTAMPGAATGIVSDGVGHAARLSPALIGALDAARAFAAVYVVIHHVAVARGWTGGAGIVLRFGQEAVIVFFLLSGCVIFANEHHRAIDPVPYLKRRLRRIYPILVVAMGVSTIVSLLDGTFAELFDTRSLLGTLIGFQDVPELKPGIGFAPYLGNTPLWSLSYEVWFYLAFPAVIGFWKQWPARTTNVIGFVCCAAYVVYMVWPSHFALVITYFLLWWTGALIADAYLMGARSALSIPSCLGWLSALVMLAIVAVALDGFTAVGVYPGLMVRHFGVALLFTVVLFGPVGAMLTRWLKPFAPMATAVASISFGLYVFHYPLLVQSRFAEGLAGLALMSAVLVALSVAFDHGLRSVLSRSSARPRAVV